MASVHGQLASRQKQDDRGEWQRKKRSTHGGQEVESETRSWGQEYTLLGHTPVTLLWAGSTCKKLIQLLNLPMDESTDKHSAPTTVQSPSTHLKILGDVLDLNCNNWHNKTL